MNEFHRESHKIVAYSIAAARDKLLKKKGNYQLMGVNSFYILAINQTLLFLNQSMGEVLKYPFLTIALLFFHFNFKIFIFLFRISEKFNSTI